MDLPDTDDVREVVQSIMFGDSKSVLGKGAIDVVSISEVVLKSIKKIKSKK